MAHHVVTIARVNEVVGLRASVLTSTEERQAVLHHASGVVIAHDDLQTAFQILALLSNDEEA